MDDDLLSLLAGVNPIPPGTGLYPALADDLYADVMRRVEALPGRRRHRLLRRHYVVVVVAAILLVVPALALSGTLDGLFGFSAVGTPPTVPIASTSLSALDRLGASPGTVRLVATREGEAFYAARSTTGQLCVGVADAGSTALSFDNLRCGGGGSDSFPSAGVPVIETSAVFGQDGSADVFMHQLAGFAVDGVARVAASGPSGVVISAEVKDNVFFTDVPHEPVTAIEAFDAAGNLMWTRPLIH